MRNPLPGNDIIQPAFHRRWNAMPPAGLQNGGHLLPFPCGEKSEKIFQVAQLGANGVWPEANHPLSG
jgi:hypothetical protein